MKPLGFVAAMSMAKDGLNVWAEKPTNKMWWKLIDDTPIPNDLLVCIAEQFSCLLIDPTDTAVAIHIKRRA